MRHRGWRQRSCDASGAGRSTRGMDPAAIELHSAEFLAVDVETNGRAGDDCELTEVGAVLVGGGELHEEFESLVRVERPLSRGIERLTGITQAMVDAAPAPSEALSRLEELMRGRVLVAHSAQFDRRALMQGFERAGLRWPDPPVLCTIAMARRYAPLATQRSLAPLAAGLGIEVEVVHRALADARTCARVFCALFPKLCASARTVADACSLLAPRRRMRRPDRQPGRRVPPAQRPDLSKLPDDPGVYGFRDEAGRPLYVGKSVSLRTRARAHFCAPAGWTERPAVVHYIPTASELGALVLENRLIKRWRPPGNVKLKRTDGYLYLRCRLDIPFPVLEVAPDPAAGHAINVGPVRGRAAATELVDQLNSLFGLRHCGRALRLREHPSAYGQMGRCLSPCLGDLDPNLYRRRLDEALSLFVGDGQAGSKLTAHVYAQMHAAAAEQRFERAEWLRRRARRLSTILEKLGGVLEATHTRPRVVVAPHPTDATADAFFIVSGRLRDWGAVGTGAEMTTRTQIALARGSARRGELTAHLPVDEVDEMRIVATWLAS